MFNPKLKNGIIIVVTAVWATNFGAGLFIKDYESDPAVQVAFLTIVGGLFALGKGNNSGSGSGEHKKNPGDTA